MAILQAVPPGTATINWSVEYLPTNTFFSLPGPELKREGGREGWEKTLHKNWQASNKATLPTLCKELQAGNCLHKSQGAPAKSIGLTTPSIIGKTADQHCHEVNFA